MGSSPASDKSPKSRRTIPPRELTWRQYFRRIIISLALVLGAHAVWMGVERYRLNAVIAELRGRGEPADVRDFVEAPVPDSENAATEILAAGAALVARWNAFDDHFRPELPLDPEDVRVVEEMLQVKSEVLALLRAASRKTSAKWGIDPFVHPVDRRLSFLSSVYFCAIFTNRALLVAHQQGREGETLEYLHWLLALKRAVEQARPGGAPHRTVYGEMDVAGMIIQVAPDLNVVPAPEAAGDSAVTIAQVRALIDKLLDEGHSRQATLDGLRRQRVEEPREFVERMPGAASRYFFTPLFDRLRRDMTIQYGRSIDAFVGTDNFVDYVQAIGSDGEVAVNFLLFDSPMRLHTAFVVRRFYDIIADRRMAATVLAIRCYAVEHQGQRPSSLEQLVPRYLPAVPRDPFAPGGAALRYRPAGDNPCVYSVGVNAVDDNGSELSISTGFRHPDRWQCFDSVLPLNRPPRSPRWFAPSEGPPQDDDQPPPQSPATRP